MARIPKTLLPIIRHNYLKGSYKYMRVSRNFMRFTGKDMDPLTFRLLCNGLSYKYGWSVRRCMNDTGYSRNVVYRHLHKLIATGYAEKYYNIQHKKWSYRFTSESGKFKEVSE